MRRNSTWIRVVALSLILLGGWQIWSRGQQPAKSKNAGAANLNRLDFEVVQSFDAKYEGDTPGHMGRAGGLQNRRPRAALGDPIYRGDEKVGQVTGLSWNRTNGSLDIEFDPIENVRVSVGDEVWMLLSGSAAEK
jgi:hypothetical protein